MASRRAVVSLVRTSVPSARTATPAHLRAPAHLASRQYDSYTPRQPLPVARSSPLALRNKPSSRSAITRAYSTDSGAPPSKIWDFEALEKLTTAPHPSITIIDVREPHELTESGRIPGAINIPVSTAADSFHISEEEFEDRFGHPRPARDAEVVFYCRAGVRSRAAAGLARDAGWEKVGEYPGSWLDWAGRGGEVER
ncbi:Rhodanese-like domain-containing protein [Chaetomium tenue]|uniref:Rhodanese-like domain-containing protein n=1 Tax=Chaetomium tenue TaxID=1854479 RepID=A0ACB7P5Z2_9PEZI|nr:Rhodanese-like domain-containing protein [Chaetomium globosum]